MGLFGIDANKTQQSLTHAETAASGGSAFGAVTGAHSVGAASQGNILGGITAGKGATVNISTPDAAAIAAVNDIAHSNTSLSMAALKANQDLSTLAVSYAAQNANTALETLQQLQTQSQVVSAGGSASDVAGVAGGYSGTDTTPGGDNTKTLLIVAGVAAGLFIVYLAFNH